MTQTAGSRRPAFRDLFTPKLLTVLREGYGPAELRADALAGLTVAIVALPLSMAIAIASGVTPDKGLYTAIVGGFLVSALGGSRFQVGGPAGAFIVLVAATVAQHGVEGLILATFVSGIFLAVAGYLQLGTYIKFIPYPVTVGFTAGIAVIIFASQLHELFGLSLTEQEPGALLPKLLTLVRAADTVNPMSVGIAVLTIATIALLKRWNPRWPGMLFAVSISAVVAGILDLPVETIGSRFQGIPRTLPLPHLPVFGLDNFLDVLPSALAFTLLGTIESLLSAVVADGMTGCRHRSNCELVAQGFANIGSSLFGGFCVTGTIARTATNVRAGARGPVAGMLHAVFLLLFLLIAAPLASFIPLAALAGVLVIVAHSMVEKYTFAALLRSSRGDALVLLVTFFLVILRDLVEGIVVGFVLGAILFIDRMGKSVRIENHAPLVQEDVADSTNGGREAYDAVNATDPEFVVYRISGAFFFGAASTVGSVLDRIADRHKTFVLDCSAVPFLDSTAANVLRGAALKARRSGVRFIITGTTAQDRRMLITHGVNAPLVEFVPTITDALELQRVEH